jgi:hypothetical protein
LEDPVGAEVGVYAVERVDASKGANGEATIQRVRRSINTDLTATGAVVQAIGWNENGEATEYARVWLGVSQGGANTLIGTAPFSAAGIASSDFTIDGVGFDHVRVSRESDPQTGNVNVVQIGRSTADDTWKKIWSYPQEELADFHKEVVQVNALNYEYTEGRKVTTSRSSALTWANGSNACPVGWRGCVIAQKCGSVRELPGGILYVATKITWGSGTNGNVDLT